MPHECHQGFQLLDRKFFSWRLKVSKDAVSLKSLGSEFHVLGPQKEKNLSPIVFNFNLGVTNTLESDDDLRWRDGVYNSIYLLNKKGHCHKYICDT